MQSQKKSPKTSVENKEDKEGMKNKWNKLRTI